ncbi:restriction endonuclease subunit S [Acinetobacter indicus]|uniref:restriction endonuclease subunit S n=1 Tax=Acinetobacter indicus TaxID=756892 RepID=UPI001362C487|nr:restriction endonuclease subunit S [Acinetobacter indicus]
MDFKEYPSYKDSGVEWLGEVPEHWDVKRLKYLFSIKNGATPKSNVSQFWDGDIKWVTPSDLSKLESHEIAESSRTITVEGFNSCGTNLVPAGSIIVSCRAPIGSLAITLTSLCTNQGCKSLVASKILNIKFYFYFLSISADKLNSLGNGTTFLELSSFELKNLSILAPRLEEQAQIVAFLDTETSRIDNLIAKQEKLIEKLEEHRKSVISHAVTKGLDPSATMRDSGVEWLGEVPEHWYVTSVKRAYNVKLGKMLQPEKKNENDVLKKFLKASNISWTDISSTENEMWFSENDILQLRLEKGDLLITEGGDVGKSCIWDSTQEMYYQNSINRVRPKPNGLNKFLYYFIFSLKSIGYIDILCNKATIAHFTAEKLNEMILLLPSINEQIEIVQYLDEKCLKINNLIGEQNRLITKLKEYRTSIISHAVTGKIDVRDLVA